MSIIERVGDRLGPMLAPQRKPKAAEDEAAAPAPAPDLIERAVANRQVDRVPAEPRDFPEVLPEIPARPRAPGKVSTRTLHIDVERLHKQCIITPDSSRTPIGESFRRVKRHILANIVNAEPGVPGNLVMMTSPFANEGKTFCSINLAISLAMEMDRTVLLVDADVAKPSVPGVLGFKTEKGLMDVLYNRDMDLSDVLCRTNIDKLTVLPAGKGRHHATELLGSDAMRAMLQEMAERYSDRIIVFDSPPLLAASEASVLAAQMGQIVMVVESGKTTEQALRDALSRIQSCRNVGLLLNKVDGPGLGQGGYYGYGYGYGYGQ
jgi:receptor protein-tyrosine kinase